MSDRLNEIYSKMNADPRFIALDFEQQKLARASVAADVMARDPRFQAFGPDQQAIAVDAVSDRVPALSDKAAEAQVDEVVRRARAGDPQAMTQLQNIVGLNAQTRSSVIASLFALTAGLIGDRGLAEPTAQFGAKLVREKGLFSALKMSLLPQELQTADPVSPANVPKSLLIGDDASKLNVYFGYLGQKDPMFRDLPGKQRTQQIVGALVDMIPFILIPSAMAEAAVAKGAAGLAAKTTSRLVADVAKVVLPGIADVTVGGIGNVLRQNLLGVIQKAPELYTDTVAKTATVWGQGAAVDFLVGIVMRMPGSFGIPSLREMVKLTRRSYHKPVGEVILQADDVAGLDAAIKAQGGTRALPLSVTGVMHPSVRDTSWLRNATGEVMDTDLSKLDLRPLDQTIIAAQGMPDTVFAPVDWTKPLDGPYNIWELRSDKIKGKMSPKYLMVGEADSLGDLRSKLADMAYERYSGLMPQDQSKYLEGGRWLVEQGQVQAMSARAYDPYPEKIVRKTFLKPSLRGYVSPTEAQDAAFAAVANGGAAYRVKIDLDEMMVKRIAANKSMLTDANVLDVRAMTPDKSNALVLIAKPATPEALASAEQFVVRATAEGMWTADEARKFFLVQNGFDGIVDLASNRIQAFFPSRVKWVTESIVAETGKLAPLATVKARASSILGNRLYVQAKIEAVVGAKTLAENPKALAQVAMGKFKGSLEAEDVKHFAAQILEAKGVEMKGVRVVQEARTANEIFPGRSIDIVKLGTDEVQVTIPKTITTPQAQRAFIVQMLEGLDKVSELEIARTGLGRFATLKARNLGRLLETSPSRFALPFDEAAANLKWLRNIAYTEFGGSMIAAMKDGKYALVDAAGELQASFKSLGELSDALLLSSLDTRFIRGDLYRQGYRLSGGDGKPYKLAGPGLTEPLENDDLHQLLSGIDYRPSSVSNRLAPVDVVVEAKDVRVTFDGERMSGGLKEIKKSLSKFENPDELAKMVQVKSANEGDVYKIAEGSFRVDVPKVALTRYFPSEKEATEFLGRDLRSLYVMQEIANSKGLTFFYDYGTGGYLLSDGRSLIQAKTADDVQAVFKRYPDTPGAREILSALDPQADEEVRQVLAEIDPEFLAKWKSFNRPLVEWDSMTPVETPMPGKAGPLPTMRAWIRDLGSSTRRYTEETIVRQLGMKELGRKFTDVMRATEATATELAAGERVLAAILGDVPLERRIAMVAFKEAAGDPDLLANAVKQFGELSARETSKLSQLTRLTDSWARKFGITSSNYIKGYVSHIRKWIINNMDQAQMMVSAEEILDAAFKGKAPARIKAFFLHDRAADLIDISMEQDPLKIFQKYNTTGQKFFYMRQPMSDVLQHIKVNEANIPPETRTYILMRLNQMGGFHEIQGMREVTGALGAFHTELRKIFPKLKPTTAETGQRMFRSVMGASYMGLIGFRPWFALRNNFQIWSMLAPRVGAIATERGMRAFLDGGDELARTLRAEGLLMRDLPIVNQIVKGDAWYERLIQRSMRSVKSSDDMTRGVAAMTAKTSLDEAVTKWNAGLFKGDVQKFVDYAHLDSIQKTQGELTERIARLATSGDVAKVDQAKFLFAEELVKETMADYSMYNQPKMWNQNVIGYTFGRFGAYSNAYRENIYRGWVNAKGLTGKTAFVTRFIGMNMAIYGGLKAAGIKGWDFIPGYPGLFGGGPQFDLALNAFQAPTLAPGGSQARYALQRALSPVVISEAEDPDKRIRANVPSFVPGSLHYYYAKQMIGYIEEGEWLKALYAFGTIPTIR